MADEEDGFDGVNGDGKTQIDETIIRLAEQYAASLRRSSEENDERTNIRANATKLGIPSKAFQQGVSMVKLMDPGERKDHQRGLKRMLSVLGDKAKDLFPEDVERQVQRAERRREAAAKTAKEAGAETAEEQERRIAADTNPRSDPKRGGAGKKPKAAALPPDALMADGVPMAPKGRPSEAELTAADEQAEGAQALAAGLPETRKAQSALAADKLAKAGLN